MKKIYLVFVGLISFATVSLAQNTDSTAHKGYSANLTTNEKEHADNGAANKKNKWNNFDFSRANDHFMIQLGYTNWIGAQNPYTPVGLSREFNMYFMLDKLVKGNPHYSGAAGIGLGNPNWYFDHVLLDIAGSKVQSSTGQMYFVDAGASDYFKKTKIAASYLEVPLEFRYAGSPETPNKGWKAAVGIKGGLLLKAWSKGKNMVNSAGQTIYGTGYREKEYSTRYFNSTRISATVRGGYGIVSLYGTYQLTSTFKSGALLSTINPYSVGIALSGL
ncbi:MAG: PorT family protein [Chitinophagaceae bacterium]|jgi:hypothetical protein|nr:PorT family protein [Chitinophagaceae bacterium]